MVEESMESTYSDDVEHSGMDGMGRGKEGRGEGNDGANERGNAFFPGSDQSNFSFDSRLAPLRFFAKACWSLDLLSSC